MLFLKKHHYFIALSLSQDEKNSLYERVKELNLYDSFKKWVYKEDFHLTLAFIGAAKEEDLKICMNEIEKRLQNEPDFSLRITHFDTFGLQEKPRIFYCAPNNEILLYSLQKIVANICRKQGFNLDDKPFCPHITLARKYSNDEPFTVNKLTECSEVFQDSLILKARNICLFETHMDNLPKYKVIRTVQLKRY